MVCGEPYLDDPGHQDTAVRLYAVADDSLVTEMTVGYAETNPVVSGLTLLPGERYRVQLRYQDTAGDWSFWTPNFVVRVPIELGYAPISVAGEPAVGGEMPVLPSFPLELEGDAPFHEWVTDTGHRIRRPRHAGERLRVAFAWSAVTTAERDAIAEFVGARAKAGESFTVSHGDLQGRAWFARDGRVESRQVAPGFHEVSIDADEVFPPEVTEA